VKNRVGEENDGWTVAKYLLEFERGGSSAPGLWEGVEKIRAVAEGEQAGTGQRLIDDPAFSRKLADTEIELKSIEMTEHRMMAELAGGKNPGPASSMLKTKGTEMRQRLDEIAIETIAYYAGVDQMDAREPGSNVEPIGPAEGMVFMPSYLNNRAASIYGGSNEVQRNIMAKLVLGL
jgi:acyl-CoA dehydrogenase